MRVRLANQRPDHRRLVRVRLYGDAEFPDYPKYAVWPDAYYVTSATSPARPPMPWTAASMLAGAPATYQRFTATNLAGFRLPGADAGRPGRLDPPPTGTPGYFIRHRDDEVHNVGSNNPNEDYLEIWEFDVDWATPGQFDLHQGPGCGDFRVRFRPLRTGILQLLSAARHHRYPGPAARGGDVAASVPQFGISRDPGGQSGDRCRRHRPWRHPLVRTAQERRRTGACIRRGLTRRTATTAGWAASPWTGRATWPSVTASRAQPCSPVSAIRAGSLAIPCGTMPLGEYTIINGGGYSSSNRWGDYSSMNVDPVDDCTFWYTMEYPTASNTWNTQIASFAFDSCTNPAVSWDKQIFVTQSTDYGLSWSTPAQITNNTDEQYHPRIAAAHGTNAVVVAYTHEWVLSRRHRCHVLLLHRRRSDLDRRAFVTLDLEQRRKR